MIETAAWLAAPAVLLVALTVLGARRRGNPWVLAGLAGLVFPLTWVLWYVRDELPRRRVPGRAGT